MNETFTPDNPMYPDVTVRLADTGGDAFALVAAVSDALRSKYGHNAANWFENATLEQGSVTDLRTFIRSTVRVS